MCLWLGGWVDELKYIAALLSVIYLLVCASIKTWMGTCVCVCVSVFVCVYVCVYMCVSFRVNVDKGLLKEME